MDLGLFIEIVVGGLTNGMLLFIVAAGLTFVFGVLHVINFAHGALYMLSAYLGYSVCHWFGDTPGSYWLALILAPLATGIIGAGIEIALLRPMYKREHLMQLLLTYSLALVIADLTKFFWGADPKMVALPEILGGFIEVGTAMLPIYNLVIVGLGLAAMIALHLFINKTRLGHIIRAGAFDAEMTENLGINLRAIYTLIFALGAWLCGLAGVLIAPMTTVAQGMDATMLLDAFAVVVIGGMGSIGGSLIAAIIVGLFGAFGLLWFPGLAIAFTFVVMAVILLIRPWGLFGRPQE